MLGYYAVMSNFSQQTTRLLDQVRNVLRLEHYSYRTEEAYVQWIKRFIVFNVRLGDNMKKFAPLVVWPVCRLPVACLSADRADRNVFKD